eukprot:403350765
MLNSTQCKTDCLDTGQKFCPNADFTLGNCCQQSENCQITYLCSDQAPLTSALRYFTCPIQIKCGNGNSKYVDTTSYTVNKVVTYNKSIGNLVTGDVCSFQYYSSKYNLNEKIRITTTKLNGANAYIFSGGFGLDTSLTQTKVEMGINYQFPADQRIYYVVVPNLRTTADYIIDSILIKANQTSNSSNTINVDGQKNETNTTIPEVSEGESQTLTIGMVAIIIVCVSLFGCLFTIMVVYCCIRARRNNENKILDIKHVNRSMSQNSGDIFKKKKTMLMQQEEEIKQLQKDKASGKTQTDEADKESKSSQSVTKAGNTDAGNATDKKPSLFGVFSQLKKQQTISQYNKLSTIGGASGRKSIMVDIKNSLNSSHKPTKSEQNLTKFTSNQSQHNKSANNAFGKVAMNVMNVKKFASSKTQKEQSPQTKGEDQANSTGFKLKKIKLPPLKNLKGQKNQDHSKSINNMEYSQMNNENGPDIDHEQPQHTASPNHEKNQDKLRNQHDKVDNNSKTPQNNPFLSDYKIDTNIADQRTLKSNNSDNKHQNQSQQLQNDNKFSLPPISLSKLNIMDDKKPQNNDKKLTLQGVFSVADKASKLIGKKKKKKKKSLGVGGRDETYLENTIEDQQNDKQKDDQVCDSDSNNQ